MKYRKYGLWLLLILVLFPGFSPPDVTAAEREIYTIGVIPAWPPVPTHKQWAPFAERLEQDAGLALRLKIYEEMSDFERDIVAPDGPDFIFANALQTVVAHEAQGYMPLVRGGPAVRSLLFVRRDSSFKTIEDLTGKRIAFVGDKNL